jgi:hypothetical protein
MAMVSTPQKEERCAEQFYVLTFAEEGGVSRFVMLRTFALDLRDFMDHKGGVVVFTGALVCGSALRANNVFRCWPVTSHSPFLHLTA